MWSIRKSVAHGAKGKIVHLFEQSGGPRWRYFRIYITVLSFALRLRSRTYKTYATCFGSFVYPLLFWFCFSTSVRSYTSILPQDVGTFTCAFFRSFRAFHDVSLHMCLFVVGGGEGSAEVNIRKVWQSMSMSSQDLTRNEYYQPQHYNVQDICHWTPYHRLYNSLSDI